jgi:hypothetical protein
LLYHIFTGGIIKEQIHTTWPQEARCLLKNEFINERIMYNAALGPRYFLMLPVNAIIIGAPIFYISVTLPQQTSTPQYMQHLPLSELINASCDIIDSIPIRGRLESNPDKHEEGVHEICRCKPKRAEMPGFHESNCRRV